MASYDPKLSLGEKISLASRLLFYGAFTIHVYSTVPYYLVVQVVGHLRI